MAAAEDPKFEVATRPLIPGPPPDSEAGPGGMKKALMPLGVIAMLLWKFKAAAFAVLKFLPVLLKTGGTMILSVGAYAMAWGWWFALGFVLLLFVHECGHLVAARRVGLKVGAPVFIPFMGAFIALKEAPRNAWIEAQVGIGGPLLGSIGAALCLGIYYLTGIQLFAALAYTGFFLNLFNLAPAGMLDGGRVVTALSPWLWVLGVVGLGVLLVYDLVNSSRVNPILVLVVLFAMPRVLSLFRPRTDEERRYFEVTPGQRWFMGSLYFGLILLLVLGMGITHLPV